MASSFRPLSRQIKISCLSGPEKVTPDGLITNLYGPESGRRHDAYLLQASGVLPNMQQNMNVNGQPLCLYGDSKVCRA
jgi:hypothetical protein